MEVSKTENTPRTLEAIIGVSGAGLFIRTNNEDQCIFINSLGIGRIEGRSLEQVLLHDDDRTPVYAGDKITLQF